MFLNPTTMRCDTLQNLIFEFCNDALLCSYDIKIANLIFVLRTSKNAKCYLSIMKIFIRREVYIHSGNRVSIHFHVWF